MGTGIPNLIPFPPSLPGNACSVCWGTGKPFGDDDTPEELHVSVSGINKGATWVPAFGEPINGIFTITQLSGAPCWYIWLDGLIRVELRFAPDGTSLLVQNASNVRCFTDFGGDICRLEFKNVLDDIFVGGTAIVTIPPVQS